MDNVLLFLRESNAIEDVWDARSLGDAKKAWDYLIQFDTLSKEKILKAHDILMEKHLPKKDRGVFRKDRVWVGKSEGAQSVIIPGLIKMWVNAANIAYPEHIDDKDLHVQFERIHPFIDGNGRVGRILLNWCRVKATKPILVIYEKDKYAYYEWFRK